MAVKIAPKWTNTRYSLVQDDSCHWYLIPARDREKFDAWVEYWSNDGKGEYLGPDFEENRLSGSPSNVTFSDPEEEL